MDQREVIIENNSSEAPTGSVNVLSIFRLNSLRNLFRCVLLAAISVTAGCGTSYVKQGRNYTTWEPIGEEVCIIKMPFETEILVTAASNGYLNIIVTKTCEIRKVKRTVTQLIYHEEKETYNLVDDFFLAGVNLILGPVLISSAVDSRDKANKMPNITDEENAAKSEEITNANITLALGIICTVAGSVTAVQGISTTIYGIDTKEYKDETRQTNELLSSATVDCTTNVPLILRTSKGSFPLGVTDEKGHLSVKLEDIIPVDVLISIIHESVMIEVGTI